MSTLEGPLCILFFSDEGTPGSWYVKKASLKLFIAMGDGECIRCRSFRNRHMPHAMS